MVLLLGFMLFAAWTFDRRIHPARADHDYREIFRRQPGAAIVAAGWMIIANFLVAHVILAVSHEWYTNEVTFVKYWVAFAGAFFIATAVVAHAGTIPNQDSTVWYRTTDWFKGVEAFMMAFGLWLFTDAMLCFQTLMRIMKVDNLAGELSEDEVEENDDPTLCERFLKPMLVIEIVLAFVGGLNLLLLGFRVPSMVLDAVTLFCVLAFAVLDARGIDVIFAKMRVATPTDLLVKDIDGEWALPAPVIKSIAVDDDIEDDYDGDVVGKTADNYEGLEQETLLE